MRCYSRSTRGRHTDLMVHDLAVGFHQRLGVEWRLSIQHLVHADPQRPPVALRPVAAHPVLHGLQDLRGDVVRRPHRHRGLHLQREDRDGPERCPCRSFTHQPSQHHQDTKPHRAVLHHPQAGAEVGEADVTVNIQQDVVRFDVSA